MTILFICQTTDDLFYLLIVIRCLMAISVACRVLWNNEDDNGTDPLGNDKKMNQSTT